MHDELILNNIPLIKKCIKDMRLYWNTEDEFQDYYDAGLLGLINGAKTYNESKARQSQVHIYINVLELQLVKKFSYQIIQSELLIKCIKFH